MPAHPLRFAKRPPKTFDLCLLLLACWAALPAAGQTSWLDNVSRYRYVEPVRMSLLLPMDGPSASLLNPARLASAHRGYADFGSWSGGESRSRALAAGIGFNRRFYAGLFFFTSGNGFENTNAMILNNRFGGQVAYRHPLDAEDRGSITVGIGEANRMVNSLGAFKGFSSTLDWGAVWVPSTNPGGWRLEFGWAARDLRPFSETVPDIVAGPGRTTHVDYAPWMTLASLSAENPARHWKVHGEGAAGAKYAPAFFDQPLPGWKAGAFNLYLPRLGLKYSPVPFASISLERLWNRYWAGAATVGTSTRVSTRCEAELRVANGPFLQYEMPDESGWSLAWSLRLLW